MDDAERSMQLIRLSNAREYLGDYRPVPAWRMEHLYSDLRNVSGRFCDLSRQYKKLVDEKTPDSKKICEIGKLLEVTRVSMEEYTKALSDDMRYTKRKYEFSARDIQEDEKDCKFSCVCCVCLIVLSILFLLPPKD